MQQSPEHALDTMPSSRAAPIAALTPREREVAALVAEGLTNAEIARRLILTRGTVANHVDHVIRKLRLRNRVQVAVWAVLQGLYPSPQERTPFLRLERRGRSANLDAQRN
jgi:DNA-binding CsgD family transcriptional regulator